MPTELGQDTVAQGPEAIGRTDPALSRLALEELKQKPPTKFIPVQKIYAEIFGDAAGIQTVRETAFKGYSTDILTPKGMFQVSLGRATPRNDNQPDPLGVNPTLRYELHVQGVHQEKPLAIIYFGASEQADVIDLLSLLDEECGRQALVKSIEEESKLLSVFEAGLQEKRNP